MEQPKGRRENQRRMIAAGGRGEKQGHFADMCGKGRGLI